MLFAYPIIDGSSYGLDEYFQNAWHSLDEAAGIHITLLYIGDPEQCGEVHRGLRSAKLRQSDSRDARRYVEDIHKTGRERHHRLGEMKKLQKTLGLSSREVPCIAFLSRTGERPLAILRIPSSWYESRAALKVFDEHLQSWLCQKEVRHLATAHLSESDLSPRLKRLLAPLTTRISDEITSISGGVRSRNRAETSAAAVTLRMCSGTYEVFYKGLAVDLTPTQFRLLQTLAQSAGRIVLHDTLASKASRYAGEFEGSPIVFAKNHKLSLMKRLRRLVGQQGITQDEIDGLITARKGGLILNLPPDQVAPQ